MSKLFRFGLMFLIFLDVAVFPFACRSNSDRNRVYIHVMTETEEDGHVTYDYALLGFRERLLFDYKVGDTITEEKVIEYIDNFKVEEGEYTIEKYKIMNNDINAYKEITLPYKMTSEDTLGYLRGIRGAAHLVVIVKVDVQENTGEQ